MRQHLLNLVAFAVIASGGGYLLATPQPATAGAVTTMATCEQDGKKLTGDCCYINEDGNCQCEDGEC